MYSFLFMLLLLVGIVTLLRKCHVIFTMFFCERPANKPTQVATKLELCPLFDFLYKILQTDVKN
jgi:hypothetical protein